jgi:hypothetical protein
VVEVPRQTYARAARRGNLRLKATARSPRSSMASPRRECRV